MSAGENPGLHLAPSPGERAGSGGGRRTRRLAAGLLMAVLAVLAAGWLTRRSAASEVAAETRRLAVPTVAVVHPRQAAAATRLSLPATLLPESDAPIYARTSGYLRRRYVDLGAHVEEGQLLAEIEAPEVDEQLRQARSQLATAQANERLARITAARYDDLLSVNGVSQQEADNARGNLEAMRATAEAAASNARRLETLQRFQRIQAPFAGTVTARNTDVGALIDAGASGGAARELFHLADTRTMRVYVNVPQAYSRAVRVGMKAEVGLADLPGRTFEAVLRRTSEAIDPASRTLRVELAVPNPDGALLPGAFAEVHLDLGSGAPARLLPATALLFRAEGLRVATVGPDGRAVLRPIETGRDLGAEVEVVSGVGDDDRVIVSPPDSIAPGDAVKVVGTPGSSVAALAR